LEWIVAMLELGQGRVVVKESCGHFIPDLPDFGKKKNRVGASRGANSGQCDCGMITDYSVTVLKQISYLSL
jgi:hypothetical protein